MKNLKEFFLALFDNNKEIEEKREINVETLPSASGLAGGLNQDNPALRQARSAAERARVDKRDPSEIKAPPGANTIALNTDPAPLTQQESESGEAQEQPSSPLNEIDSYRADVLTKSDKLISALQDARENAIIYKNKKAIARLEALIGKVVDLQDEINDSAKLSRLERNAITLQRLAEKSDKVKERIAKAEEERKESEEKEYLNEKYELGEVLLGVVNSDWNPEYVKGMVKQYFTTEKSGLKTLAKEVHGIQLNDPDTNKAVGTLNISRSPDYLTITGKINGKEIERIYRLEPYTAEEDRKKDKRLDIISLIDEVTPNEKTT